MVKNDHFWPFFWLPSPRITSKIFFSGQNYAELREQKIRKNGNLKFWVLRRCRVGKLAKFDRFQVPQNHPQIRFFEMSGPVATPPGIVGTFFFTKKMRLDLSFKMRGRTASYDQY